MFPLELYQYSTGYSHVDLCGNEVVLSMQIIKSK